MNHTLSHLPHYHTDAELPHIPQPSPIVTAGCTWGWVLIAYGFTALLFFVARAAGADTLAPVAAPTDWTGVLIAGAFAAVVVGLILYVHYLKQPGMQVGEATFDKLLDLMHKMEAKISAPVAVPVPVVIPGFVPDPTPTPIVYDGITFASADKLSEYKAAQQVVAAYKPAP